MKRQVTHLLQDPAMLLLAYAVITAVSTYNIVWGHRHTDLIDAFILVYCGWQMRVYWRRSFRVQPPWCKATGAPLFSTGHRDEHRLLDTRCRREWRQYMPRFERRLRRQVSPAGGAR